MPVCCVIFLNSSPQGSRLKYLFKVLFFIRSLGILLDTLKTFLVKPTLKSSRLKTIKNTQAKNKLIERSLKFFIILTYLTPHFHPSKDASSLFYFSTKISSKFVQKNSKKMYCLTCYQFLFTLKDQDAEKFHTKTTRKKVIFFFA